MFFEVGNETLSEDTLNFQSFLTPLISVFILIFLMMLMVYCYRNQRYFLVILTIWSFSLIFGMISIQNWSLPFTPYFQIFFMVIQSVYFLQTSLQFYGKIKQ